MSHSHLRRDGNLEFEYSITEELLSLQNMNEITRTRNTDTQKR